MQLADLLSQPSGLLYLFQYPVFSTSSEQSVVPYNQPPSTELLILLSFLVFLNAARAVADYVLHAGIIAEIGLGIIYGSPLAAILPSSWEVCFTVLGYLGLIGVVFEGGLTIDLHAVLSNLPLSMACALIGVALPIALSFALLQAAFKYRPLEAFAAGSALSSTSLGTTLMALSSISDDTIVAQAERTDVSAAPDEVTEKNAQIPGTNRPRTHTPLHRTRIGTILISAAVIDDVLGLVLASLIPALSVLNDNVDSHNSSLTWIVVRPMLASVLMAVVTAVVARFILRPAFWYHRTGERLCAPWRPGAFWGFGLLRVSATIGVSSDRARWGTRGHADSVQFSICILSVSALSAIAFYTGSSVLFGAFLAGLTLSYVTELPKDVTPSEQERQSRANELSFEKMYQRTVGPLQQHLLAPLFFASIGFAIPFISLWRPQIIWRGIVYAILMCLGKIATGIPIFFWSVHSMRRGRIPSSSHSTSVRGVPPVGPYPTDMAVAPTNVNASDRVRNDQGLRVHVAPAMVMGIAMVARGEIGLLIAQIARGDTTYPGLLSDDTFLICTWAILLCTLVGPIGVGFVVKHSRDSLGSEMWG